MNQDFVFDRVQEISESEEFTCKDQNSNCEVLKIFVVVKILENHLCLKDKM